MALLVRCLISSSTRTTSRHPHPHPHHHVNHYPFPVPSISSNIAAAQPPATLLNIISMAPPNRPPAAATMLFLHHQDMDHVCSRSHSSDGYGNYHASSPTAHVNTSATSLYDVLQIPSTATSAEVKAAFRRLARLYHPDAVARHSSLSGPATTTHTATAEEIDRTTQHFLRIHAAYTALSDPQLRARYDLQLRLLQNMGPSSSAAVGCQRRSSRKNVRPKDVGSSHGDASSYPSYGRSMRPRRSWESDQCW